MKEQITQMKWKDLYFYYIDSDVEPMLKLIESLQEHYSETIFGAVSGDKLYISSNECVEEFENCLHIAFDDQSYKFKCTYYKEAGRLAQFSKEYPETIGVTKVIAFVERIGWISRSVKQ